MMTGWATQAAVAGVHSAVGLYNSGGPGMYCVVTHAAVTSTVAIVQSAAWWYKGNPGTVVPLAAFSIDPSSGVGPGQIVNFTLPSAIGNNFAVSPIEGSGWSWKHEYPLIYLPPGHTLYFSTTPAGSDTTAWFQWWWTNTPY